MVLWRAIYIPVFAFAVACSLHFARVAVAADGAAASQSDTEFFQSDAAEQMICDAASLPRSELDKLSKPQSSKRLSPKSFTWVILALPAPKFNGSDDPRRKELSPNHGGVDPDAFVHAIEVTPVEGRPSAVSVLQPKFISKLVVAVDGSKACGVATFTIDGQFSGRVHFACERKQGKWSVVEFSLPAYGVKTSLQPNGQWKPWSKSDNKWGVDTDKS